ncbi:MAG: hypothetical protein PHF97_12625 [Bacteroidales bacterium]|nr:hypothetical protein [Bacteroidales bacterium]
MKILITILILSISSSLWSQSENFPYFIDHNEIVSTVDSLKKIRVNKILIVRTELIKLLKIADDSVLSIILWPSDSGRIYLQVISSNSIILPFKANLDPKIFEYQNIEKTFISKSEDILRFVPPLTNLNAIFYISENKSGYYEQSDHHNKSPVTYVPNNSAKEKYRKEWFDLIINALNKVDYSSRKSKYYDRMKELDEQK